MMVIFIVTATKGVFLVKYGHWKTAQEAKPTPMKLKNGVYVPNGIIQRIDKWWTRFAWVWGAWMLTMIVALLLGYRIQ